jgi:heptosyltransferase I
VPAIDLRSRDFQRILLIKLSAVGDVVQTIAVANKLRRRYPKARLDWLTTPAMAELLQHNPAISNAIEFAREEWRRPWRLAPYAGAVRLAARLRAAHYDLVIDLQGQLRSAAFALAAGTPVRIGFDRPRASTWAASRKVPDDFRKHSWQGAREGSWLAYTHHIPLPTLDIHSVDHYLSVGKLLGVDDLAADFSFPIPPEASGRIDALLDYYGIAKSKLVVLGPGSNWETKQWRGDGFAEVARHFLKKGFAVTLVGSERERALCDDIVRNAPGTVSLAGETLLSELAALIRRSSICLAHDSGPTHLAVALGRPVVGIYGPSDPVWAAPYRRDGAVLKADLPCSPCYLRQLSLCRHGHACMQNVSAQAVIERMESVLAKQPGDAKTAASRAGRL